MCVCVCVCVLFVVFAHDHLTFARGGSPSFAFAAIHRGRELRERLKELLVKELLVEENEEEEHPP